WGLTSKTSSTRTQSNRSGGRCGRKAAHVAGKFAARRQLVRIAELCEHTFVSYVELHCHSAFSFLDGASHPIELVSAAAQQGHSALALTDHDGLHGAMEFAVAAGTLGVRPITGAELTLDDGHHLTLLCEDA